MPRIEAPSITPLLAPTRDLRHARGRVLSALASGDEGARYDRRAALYDALVGSKTYNRLAWGTSPTAYGGFALEALTAGDSWYLDVGCGTLGFTAAAYGAARRRLVLVDRSLEMLERAAGRVDEEQASLIQADLFDLPFSPRSFDTVACFGVLHLLDDPWPALRTLGEQVRPGGRLFASVLVTDRAVGKAYLRALARQGEIGCLCSSAELEQAALEHLGPEAEVTRTGNMAWLRATVN